MSRRKAAANAETSVSFAFSRGFVSAALLAAFSGQSKEKRDVTAVKIFRVALQGGTALSAGTYAARALRRRDYGLALVGVTVGAMGVLATEHLLPDTSEWNAEESRDGEEKA